MTAAVFATLLNAIALQAVEQFPTIIIEGAAAAPATQQPRPPARGLEAGLEEPIPVRTNFRRRLLSSARQL